MFPGGQDLNVSVDTWHIQKTGNSY